MILSPFIFFDVLEAKLRASIKPRLIWTRPGPKKPNRLFQRQLGFPTESGPVAFRHCLAAALAFSMKNNKKSLQEGQNSL